MENKLTLLLPNGLKVSAGDKTNKGICVTFTDMDIKVCDPSKVKVVNGNIDQFNVEDIFAVKIEEITSVQKRYDWVNALGENDFAYEGETVFTISVTFNKENVFVEHKSLTESLLNGNNPSRIFSKLSDAEKYLNKIKEKEILSFEDFIDYNHRLPIIKTDTPPERMFNGPVKTILDFAKEACKRQREICGKLLDTTDVNMIIMYKDKVLNAPEPKME